VLLIAAETTKGAGATHFKLISVNDANRLVDFTALGSVATSVVGRRADSTAPSATTATMIKPGQDAYVRVLRLAPGEQPPNGVFAVDAIRPGIRPRSVAVIAATGKPTRATALA
jgi:hypothetical protein